MNIMIFVLVFLLTAFNVFPSGIRDDMKTKPTVPPGAADTNENRGTITTITGRVEIYGNEPHTFVGIIDENGIEYAVYPSSKENELRQLQGYIIDFTVLLLNEPQGFGSLFLKGGTVEPIGWELR